MYPFYFLVFLIVLAHSSVATGYASTVKSIFILAGQSYMAGRGGLFYKTTQGGHVHILKWDGVIPPECQANPSILRLSAGLIWEEAQEPLHKGIDENKTCGVGPGMAFANTMLKKDPSIGVIGLVPCASGGTKITQWVQGSKHYNSLVRRSKAALQGGGTIQALLWYQGESDAAHSEDAELYKQRLMNFFTDVRKDLHLPELRIIQVALATNPGGYTEVIRQAQIGINLPNVKCVDAKGLPVGPDLLHLTTPAQVQLGQMLANAFLQIS